MKDEQTLNNYDDVNTKTKSKMRNNLSKNELNFKSGVEIETKPNE